MENERRIKKLIAKEKIVVGRTPGGEEIISLTIQGKNKVFILDYKDINIPFKILWKEFFNETLSRKQMMEIYDMLKMEAFSNQLSHERENRVYNFDNRYIIYDLNCEEMAVWIHPGEWCIDESPIFCFKRTRNFKNQIYPDPSADSTDILSYIEKHFNIRNEEDIVLLTIYIVSCFFGMNINYPMLSILAEKGAGKSDALRKIEELVDPKNSGLCALPKSADGLSLRLSNSYFTAFDNLSHLSQAVSDKLCMAITNGTDTDRELYMSTDERMVNIHSIIGITSVSEVVTTSDLCDRTIRIRLERLSSDEIKTEQELWEEFLHDKPKMLGAIFDTVALVLNDKEELSVKSRIRMADWQALALKIGKALGFRPTSVNKILLNNRIEMNIETVENNPSAICLVHLMKRKETMECTPSECLNAIRKQARKLGISSILLPKDASRLTRQLEKVKSELENSYGIIFSRERGRERRYIIRKKV